MFDNILALMVHNPLYYYTTVFLFSLIIGSFLNVVIHRLPIMMEQEWLSECREHLAAELKHPPNPDDVQQTYNLSLPRSACPKCGHQITALENIPILSYLVLKGKCSSCADPISIRYPLVELLTGLLSLGIAVHFGPTPMAMIYLILTWGLIALAFIDLDTMLLPDQITLSLLWLGLLASVFGIGLTPEQAIIGACVGYLSLWSVYQLFKLATGKEGFGFGDFKLLAVFGAFLGWQHILLIVFMSAIVGALFTGVIVYRKKKSIPVPFGPYIAVAGWIAMLWGEKIIHFYLNNYVYLG